MNQWGGEGDIQRGIMVALCAQWPGALVYRRNVGMAYDRTGRPIRFGLKGQADIGAIVHGRAVEIECKSATGRQTREQRDWQAAVERAGGVYVLARSVEQAIARVRQCLGIG